MTFHIINIRIAQQCIQLKGRGHLFRVNEISKPTPAQRCKAVSWGKQHAAVCLDSEVQALPSPCMLLGAVVGAIMELWSCSLLSMYMWQDTVPGQPLLSVLLVL